MNSLLYWSAIVAAAADTYYKQIVNVKIIGMWVGSSGGAMAAIMLKTRMKWSCWELGGWVCHAVHAPFA